VVSVFEIVVLVFVVAGVVAAVEWWKGPDIPRA
jgi:hypothetical protein